MPTNQRLGPIPYGFVVSGNGGSGQISLNAAANWLAYSWVPDATKTVSKIRANVASVGGTLAAADISCAIYSDVGGVPNAQLSVSTTTSPGTVAAGWVEWTGFSQSVTAGTMYWMVFKNLNGVPATNFCTFNCGNDKSGPWSVTGSANTQGWIRRATLNSGGSWATSNATSSMGYRLEYSDGSFAGFPISTTAASGSAQGVYSTRENGVRFTTPANVGLNVRGIAAYIQKSGSPTGNPRFRLYQGTSLVATTAELVAANVTAQQLEAAYFAATVTLPANTLCRMVLGEGTQSDASSNRYNTFEFTVDSDANSLALMPCDGTMQRTYFDGSAWTDTSTVIAPFMLLLDSDGPFASSGGGRRRAWGI